MALRWCASGASSCCLPRDKVSVAFTTWREEVGMMDGCKVGSVLQMCKTLFESARTAFAFVNFTTNLSAEALSIATVPLGTEREQSVAACEVITTQENMTHLGMI